MAKKILTPDEMTEARRLYERDGWGYGRIATKFSVSKPTVQGWAKNWQRDYGVAPLPAAKKAGDGVGADVGNPKVTGNAGAGEAQAGYAYRDGSPGAHGRVVADVFVPPTASQGGLAGNTPPQPTAYADEMQVPDGLDADEREAFVKAAILARQRSINARHLHETKAVRAQVYAAIKKVDKEGGAGAALAALRIVQALRHMQDSELETELERVRLALGEFAGKPKGPTPCRITVVLEKKGVRQVVEAADAQEGMRLGNGLETEIIDVE